LIAVSRYNGVIVYNGATISNTAFFPQTLATMTIRNAELAKTAGNTWTFVQLVANILQHSTGTMDGLNARIVSAVAVINRSKAMRQQTEQLANQTTDLFRGRLTSVSFSVNTLFLVFENVLQSTEAMRVSLNKSEVATNNAEALTRITSNRTSAILAQEQSNRLNAGQTLAVTQSAHAAVDVLVVSMPNEYEAI